MNYLTLLCHFFIQNSYKRDCQMRLFAELYAYFYLFEENTEDARKMVFFC